MKTLDNVMASHPNLDLRSHESYDPQAVEIADNDLMKAVLSPPSFPLLDSLRVSYRSNVF